MTLLADLIEGSIKGRAEDMPWAVGGLTVAQWRQVVAALRDGPNSEDQRDAARYRFLRDNEDIYCGGRVRGVYWIRDDLDAAIDKEMRHDATHRSSEEK